MISSDGIGLRGAMGGFGRVRAGVSGGVGVGRLGGVVVDGCLHFLSGDASVGFSGE